MPMTLLPEFAEIVSLKPFVSSFDDALCRCLEEFKALLVPSAAAGSVRMLALLVDLL